VGDLYATVSSSCRTHLLLVGRSLSAALSWIKPFKSDARVRGELVFQSIYQGIMMSVIVLFSFNRAVVSLGPRAAAVIIALVPFTATLLAIPVLGEWPSAAVISIIALGVGLAAASSNQADKKGES
jgi:drug/metabolite transporter (DMT)-like permease